MALDEFGNEITTDPTRSRTKRRVDVYPTPPADTAGTSDTGLTDSYTAGDVYIPTIENGGLTAPTDSLTAPDVATGSSYVTPEATVQGQLAQILAAGSPLQTLAERRSRDQAQQFGLLGSSMAVGAGQQALYDSALQVATPDAATYGAFQGRQQAAEYQLGQTGYEGDVTASLTGTKGLVDQAVARSAGETSKEIIGMQSEAQKDVTEMTTGSQELIARWGNASDKTIAALNNASAETIAALNNLTDAQIAELNTDTQMAIVELQESEMGKRLITDLAGRLGITEAQAAGQLAVASAEIAGRLEVTNANNLEQLARAYIEVDSNEKQNFLNAVATEQTNYMSGKNGILTASDEVYPTQALRNAALKAWDDQYMDNIDLITSFHTSENITGVTWDIDSGSGGGGSDSGSSNPVIPASSNQNISMAADGTLRIGGLTVIDSGEPTGGGGLSGKITYNVPVVQVSESYIDADGQESTRMVTYSTEPTDSDQYGTWNAEAGAYLFQNPPRTDAVTGVADDTSGGTGGTADGTGPITTLPISPVGTGGTGGTGGTAGTNYQTSSAYTSLPSGDRQGIDSAIRHGDLSEAEVAGMSSTQLRDWLTDNYGF